MLRALELARRGEGYVEPNPMVGCVIVRSGEVVGEGWHSEYGGPHAEIEALRIAGDGAAGATLYITLEPCCHAGKTPPCTRALVEAKLARVVVGCKDPNPRVAGQGLAELRAADIPVELGPRAEQARVLIAPFAKLVTKKRPWILAKWAMTLDGKLATHTGSSQWISNPLSRAVVHRLRGRVDAILVGRGTFQQDDPRLTARPSGIRTATRVVLDTAASLSPQSQLVRTASQAPILVAVGDEAPADRCRRLTQLGLEVVKIPSCDRSHPGQGKGIRLDKLLDLLGHRNMTNVLVEGGGQVLGTLMALDEIDEVHAFIGTKLVGGATAPTPIAGPGLARMMDARQLATVEVEMLEGDVYVRGLVGKRAES
jgi:diaminohydroxyphosphoribosylaminopyrimidine deaminase/5-amino-6-(5-phosphoribosylamino)uracil reductase